MSRQAITTGILAIVMIAIWNSWLYFDWMNKGPASSSLSSVSGSLETEGVTEPKLWRDLKKTIVNESPENGFEPVFDEAVVAAEGTRVELPGVGFLLSSGLIENDQREEVISEFLLLPGHGGVAWCCGLTPIPNHEFTVLVSCHDAPFSVEKVDPKSPAFFVNVEGTLRLEQENSINALYTLEDVKIEFIELQDVVPPNVMNLCLQQPMVP